MCMRSVESREGHLIPVASQEAEYGNIGGNLAENGAITVASEVLLMTDDARLTTHDERHTMDKSRSQNLKMSKLCSENSFLIGLARYLSDGVLFGLFHIVAVSLHIQSVTLNIANDRNEME
ncbi:hypothetical protein DPMN_155754 [Dreissena polymorpha]|uniref:Uncharacterized protein n=1 Tax=Dreissena polymorpha TaxID=45954 RepID=A0A9D4J853_DREPO|nr:hypothetical protein DPMN_155754 [Dreissena polymorpha]